MGRIRHDDATARRGTQAKSAMPLPVRVGCCLCLGLFSAHDKDHLPHALNHLEKMVGRE